MNAWINTILRWSATGILISLTGCSTPQPYERPVVPDGDLSRAVLQTPSVPVHLGSAQTVVPGAVPDAWWESFQSPKLNDLVDKVLEANPTLNAARAALDESEYLYKAQAGFSRDPQIAVGTGASRQRVNNAFSGVVGEPRTFNLYNASVGLLYDPDLSGVNRKRLAALAAQTDHARFQLAGIQLDLITRAVQTAFLQAQYARQVEIFEHVVDLNEESLKLVRKQKDLGIVGAAEVIAAQNRLEQSRLRIPALRQHLSQATHELAVLCGESPNSEQPVFALEDFSLPENLPLQVPSDLVRTRPDIQAAEALLRASHAEYGAAVANQYPQLVLSADIGAQAISSGNLFDSGSLVWGLAGQISKPLFSRGLKAQAEAARSSFESSGALYQQTVLQGLQQVVDALQSLGYSTQELRAVAAALQNEQDNLALVECRLSAGQADRLALITSRQNVYGAEFALSTAQAKRLVVTAAYYQALGGAPQETPVVASNVNE